MPVDTADGVPLNHEDLPMKTTITRLLTTSALLMPHRGPVEDKGRIIGLGSNYLKFDLALL